MSHEQPLSHPHDEPQRIGELLPPSCFEQLRPLTFNAPDHRLVPLVHHVELDTHAPIHALDMYAWTASRDQPFQLSSQILIADEGTTKDGSWTEAFQDQLHFTLATLPNMGEQRVCYAEPRGGNAGPLYIELSPSRWVEIDVSLHKDSAQASSLHIKTVQPHRYELLREYIDETAENSDTSDRRMSDLIRFADILMAAQTALGCLHETSAEWHGWDYQFQPLPDHLLIPAKELLDGKYGGFDSLAGYEDIKAALRNMALFAKHPEMARQVGISGNQGIILHGPPKVGKTALAEALAVDLDATLIPLDPSGIIEKWIGSSARNLTSLLDTVVERASSEKLVIVLIDDFESLVGRPRADDKERASVIATLKNRIKTITSQHPNILFIGITSHLDRIDPSLVAPNSFKPLEVPQPNEVTRREILCQLLGVIYAHAMYAQEQRPDLPVLTIGEINILELANMSDGLVAGDFVEIFDDIKREHLGAYLRSLNEGKATVLEPINHDHIESRIKRLLISREM